MTLRFLIYILCLFFIFFYSTYNYKRLKPYARGIFLLISVVLLSEIASKVVGHYYKVSHPTYHVLTPLFFFLYLSIYLKLFYFNNFIRLILITIASLAFLSSIYISFFVQSIFEFPTYTFSFLSFYVVLSSLIGFNCMLSNPIDIPLLRQPAFWFNFGNVLFYCVTFFTFGFFNPIYKLLKTIPEWLYLLIWFMNLILYRSYFLTLRLSLKPNQAE